MEKLKKDITTIDNKEFEGYSYNKIAEKVNEIIEWINRQNPVKSDD